MSGYDDNMRVMSTEPDGTGGDEATIAWLAEREALDARDAAVEERDVARADWVAASKELVALRSDYRLAQAEISALREELRRLLDANIDLSLGR